MEDHVERRQSEGEYPVLSDAQFAAMGVNRVAYVKPVPGADGETVYEVHAAEGSIIAEICDRDTAFAAIRQNDMEPLSVH